MIFTNGDLMVDVMFHRVGRKAGRGKDISQTEWWCSHHSRDRREDRRGGEMEGGRTNQEGKPFRGEERTKIKKARRGRKKETRKVGPLFALRRKIVALSPSFHPTRPHLETISPPSRCRVSRLTTAPVKPDKEQADDGQHRGRREKAAVRKKR